MKNPFSKLRLGMLCAIAAGIFASCSHKTAYNALSTPQLQAQQLPVDQDEQPLAMEQVMPPQNQVVFSQPQTTQDAFIPNTGKKVKWQAVKKAKNKIASLNRGKVEKLVTNRLSLAMSTATMGTKDEDTNNALASVGIIFLVLGLLSFLVPPLFLTALSVPGAQMLVIVAILLVAIGLLLMATGLARKAE